MKHWLRYSISALIFFALGMVTYRWYMFIPSTHPLKVAIRAIKGDPKPDASDRHVSFLQSIHVETSRVLSFIDPQEAQWLQKSNHYDWKRADNLNFMYILSSIRNDPRMHVTIAAQCHPRLQLADFHPFNSVYSDVRVSIKFKDRVPPLSTLETFDRTGFNPKLKPRVDGNVLIVALPTVPFFIDYMAAKSDAESQDQRGQIAHLYEMLALELYAFHKNVPIAKYLANKHVYAADDNSFTNHQIINATARYIRDRLTSSASS